jgi:hypothetical protein
MGKGGVILGIIALLIGAGGLSLAAINWLKLGSLEIPEIPEVPTSPEIDFWYSYKESIYTPPYLEYVTVPNLFVIVELSNMTNLHLLFTTSTRILPDPISFADMIFYFWIDGARLQHPFTRAGPYEGTATYQYIPVALQFVLELPIGVHNISITVISETAGNFMRDSTLTANKVNI